MSVEFVEVDGMRIGYRRAGDGRPLVLLHGGLCDGSVWDPVVDLLSDRFALVAWDAPGCGASSDPPPNWRMPEFAGCLATFIAALALEQPAIVGHSWGSTLALELALRYPNAIDRLVLVGAYAGWAGSLPAEEVTRRLDAVMADSPPEPTRTMAYAMAEADQSTALGGIEAPTLLVYGDTDVRAPRSVAEHMHAGMPGSQLVWLRGTGHECYAEDPAAFARAVRVFLE